MKILKVAFIIITMAILLSVFAPKSSAAQVKTFDEMKNSIQSFLNRGKTGDTANLSKEDMSNIIIPIANILTVIGIFTVIICTIIMGIKYMFATPEEAAKLKQQLIGLVVAAVVVLGATAIWRIVYTVMNSTGL